MTARELRIGNYVKCGVHYPIIEVAQLFIDSYQFSRADGMRGSLTYQSSEGIPLTEEWLLKFGFEKHGLLNHTYFFNKKLDAKFSFGNYARDSTRNLMVGTMEPIYSHRLQYVHQLQNLYFALTGSELTIKETV
jgi:hypothetical protein